MLSQTSVAETEGPVRGLAAQTERKRWLLSALASGLPTLPGYVFELNRMLGQTPTDLNQVSRVVRTDPSLTAQVLRMCTLAVPGTEYATASVDEAIVLVGTERLRTLVMTTALLEYSGKKLAVSDVQAFWQHCYLVAQLCEKMAELTGFEDPDKAYLAGLLHDLGTLLLLVLSGQEQFEGVRIPDEGLEGGLEVEREQFGLDHCEMGRWIGVSWRFPVDLIEVCEHHHDPGQARENPRLVQMVAAADEICRLRGIGIGGEPPVLRDINGERYQEILMRCMPGLGDADARRVGDGLEASFQGLFQNLEFASSGTFGGLGSQN